MAGESVVQTLLSLQVFTGLLQTPVDVLQTSSVQNKLSLQFELEVHPAITISQFILV